ncbi:MAG: right-handed parallel beta-helix repeat-containing protein [Methanotrichaceae archaeon]|nr:right-handed parallel beta-helix repeat-containing protein [Methanotrichaceae archaeon]
MMRETGLAACAILLMAYAHAATLTVDDDGEADHSSIADAIGVAQPGDTILIMSGIYRECVLLDKPLTIRGLDTGPGRPVLDASGLGSAMTLASDGIVVEGVEVIGGGDRWPEAGIKVKSDKNVLSDNIIRNNDVGIGLENCNNNTIEGCDLSENNVGVLVWSGSGNIVRKNRACKNNAGLLFLISDGNFIEDNQLSENCYSIILTEGSQGNTVNWNNISYSIDYGIHIDKADLNLIVGNIVADNDNYGISITDSKGNIVVGNLVRKNGGDGLYLEGLENSSIMNNNISENIYDGLSLVGSACNRLKGNLVWGNMDDGISLVDSIGNTITENVICKNDYGLYLDGSDNNQIYLNSITDNENAYYIVESSNSWNSIEEIEYIYQSRTLRSHPGNLWGDYGGEDSDGNGLGDEPYHFAGQFDYYPLVGGLEEYRLA